MTAYCLFFLYARKPLKVFHYIMKLLIRPVLGQRAHVSGCGLLCYISYQSVLAAEARNACNVSWSFEMEDKFLNRR